MCACIYFAVCSITFRTYCLIYAVCCSAGAVICLSCRCCNIAITCCAGCGMCSVSVGNRCAVSVSLNSNFYRLCYISLTCFAVIVSFVSNCLTG